MAENEGGRPAVQETGNASPYLRDQSENFTKSQFMDAKGALPARRRRQQFSISEAQAHLGRIQDAVWINISSRRTELVRLCQKIGVSAYYINLRNLCDI